MSESLLRRYWSDPFSYLGMHNEKGGVVVRASLPQAARAYVRARNEPTLYDLRRIDGNGLFELRMPMRREPFDYVLVVENERGRETIEDPYRFGPILGDVDAYLIAEGTHLRLWDVLGSHRRSIDGVEGVAFAVWAPNASRVSIVGDFNDWDGRRHPMRKRVECGVWEIFVPGVSDGARYKFEMEGPQGALLPLKADPLARYAEVRPANASIVWTDPPASWSDDEWMQRRGPLQKRDAAISIYEVHLGSWRRGEDNRFLTYDELADQLLPYVREMGFTHVELLPITEHPFDGSWGYQPTGMFAATSRYGTPDAFQRFVNRAHELGIGVILDWVPGHFPNDPHGLASFDGTHLYEHDDPRRGFHPDWNTLIYNHGRREVSNFLVASALYWLEEFHIDALRVDAVASMLYLDYSRRAGEWIPNQYGGNENVEAIAFIRRFNETVFRFHGDATTIAEESTAWPMVSMPTSVGGLGFGFKWNMGWMHDTLLYFSYDPVYRRFHHNNLTFGLVYAFTENYVLPLSHDEVVHGKRSLLEKMPGDRWQKFANLRMLLALQFTHPGKKLLFMGGEIGATLEWNHDMQLQWELLGDDMHAGIQRLVRDCNALYCNAPALYTLDAEPAGFEWIEYQDSNNSVLAFVRSGEATFDSAQGDKGKAAQGDKGDAAQGDRGDVAQGDRGDGAQGEGGGAEKYVVVLNATPVVRSNYRLGVPYPGEYREVINTDSSFYGGSNVGNGGVLTTQATPSHGHAHSLSLMLPPLGVLVLKHQSPGKS